MQLLFFCCAYLSKKPSLSVEPFGYACLSASFYIISQYFDLQRTFLLWSILITMWQACFFLYSLPFLHRLWPAVLCAASQLPRLSTGHWMYRGKTFSVWTFHLMLYLLICNRNLTSLVLLLTASSGTCNWFAARFNNQQRQSDGWRMFTGRFIGFLLVRVSVAFSGILRCWFCRFWLKRITAEAFQQLRCLIFWRLHCFILHR